MSNLFNDSSLRDSALAESWQSKYDSWIASGDAIAMTSEADSLQSNETFFYDSPSYLANNNQRQTRTMRTRNLNTTNQSANRANPNTKSNANRATQSTQSDKYYFILTPYVNHNYKFDMIWDSYLKARGDFYYFINEISSASVAKIKPNNLGFGASVAYGKDFNFGSGGVLGAELGLDYKALSANTLNVKSALNNSPLQDYEKALNLIYLDLGANYHKYFGDFGLNARLGIRGNLAPKLAKSKLIVSDKAIDILIDNDKFAGYISVGGSYVLNAKDFDMEFGLAFNGIYGDRVISNGGSLEWRVSW